MVVASTRNSCALAVVQQRPLRQQVIDSGDQRRPLVPSPPDEPSLEVFHRAGALEDPIEAASDLIVQGFHVLHATSRRPELGWA